MTEKTTLYKIREGNARAIFTRSAAIAREYSERGHRVTATQRNAHPAICSREIE